MDDKKRALLSVYDNTGIERLFGFFYKNDIFMLAPEDTKEKIVKDVIDKRKGSAELTVYAKYNIRTSLEKKISAVNSFSRKEGENIIYCNTASDVFSIGGKDPDHKIDIVIANPMQDKYDPEGIDLIAASVHDHPDKTLTVVDPHDYDKVIEELGKNDLEICPETKKYLDDKAVKFVKEYKDKFL
ncbi:hypothetical protein GF336_03495 [Candidatus Woesearchaeota archaeon]|nr:hypothetical protein [Candidatus Woesearchaeota archaeon]